MECIRCATCYRGALEVGRVSVTTNSTFVIAIDFIYRPVFVYRNIYSLIFTIYISIAFLIPCKNLYYLRANTTIYPAICFHCLPSPQPHQRRNLFGA